MGGKKMRKLELKDIQSYHIGENGLKCCSSGEYTDELSTLFTINGYSIDYHGIWVELDSLCALLEYVSPILHPINDLNKTIVVDGYNNGKEFIPLVELAKVGYEEVYSDSLDIELAMDEIGFSLKEDGSYQIGHFSFKNGMFEMLEYGEVVKKSKNDLDPFVEIVHIPLNQWKYFDLLNQWFFDYRGLIKMELAIDINTLKK